MSKRMVYLAYPIDNAKLSNQVLSEIERAKKYLMEDYGTVVIYDPGDAFTVAPSSQVGPEISTINNAALDQASAVLAWLPLGVASTGVPMEIAIAGMVGKPVAVLSDSYSWALQLPRNVRVFPEGDVTAAIEWLANVVVPEIASTEPMPYTGLAENGPTRSYADDAGLDLFVSEDTMLPWGKFVDVPCGVQVELPSWSWGLLVGRSSTFRRRQIEVQTGIIDAGYRGELFAACIWRPSEVGDKGYVTAKAGERLAQLIVVPNGTRDVEPIWVPELAKHDRGLNGFGSSGA